MTTQDPRPSKVLFAAVGGSLIAVAIACAFAVISPAKPNAAQLWDFRTFDRPLAPNAPGCIIRTPEGRDLNKAISEGGPGKAVIPKGTLMTIECFPLQGNEKAMRIGEQP